MGRSNGEARGSGHAWRRQAVVEARTIDNRLHDAIALACGNPFLRGELEQLKLLYRSLRDLAYEQEGPISNDFRKDLEAREHLAIVAALMAGDRRGAVRAMSRHVLSALRYFQRVDAADPGRAGPGRVVAALGDGDRRRSTGEATAMRRQEEGFPIVRHHHRILRPTRAALALAVGLGIVAGGCGEPAGTAAKPGDEQPPEGIVKLKESMKERNAAKKGGPGRAARGP
jgi:hypothetical protein